MKNRRKPKNDNEEWKMIKNWKMKMTNIKWNKKMENETWTSKWKTKYDEKWKTKVRKRKMKNKNEKKIVICSNIKN